MAAISAALMATLKAGDHVVMPCAPHPHTAEPWSAIQLFVRLGQVGKVRRLRKMSCPRRLNFETDARLEGNPGQEQMAAARSRSMRTATCVFLLPAMNGPTT